MATNGHSSEGDVVSVVEDVDAGPIEQINVVLEEIEGPNDDRGFESRLVPSGWALLVQFFEFFKNPGNQRGYWIRMMLLGDILVLPLLIYYSKATHLLSLYYSLFHHIFNTLGAITIIVEPFFRRMKPNVRFPFGYSRIDVLLSFTCGLFLAFVSLFVFLHGFLRATVDQTDSIEPKAFPFLLLFCTSFVGNMIFRNPLGMKKGAVYKVAGMFFGFASPELPSFARSSDENRLDFGESLIAPHVNTNVEILFNAVVFIMTLYGKNAFGGSFKETYYYFDVFLSLSYIFLSVGIISSISATSVLILMHTTPQHLREPIERSMREVTASERIIEVSDAHYWSLTSANTHGTLNLRVQRNASEQNVIRRVGNTLSPLLNIVTIQIEKDDWSI